MNEKFTLDSNILIYAFGKQGDMKKTIAKNIILECSSISIQVINETIQILYRKFNFPVNELQNIIDFLKKNFTINDLHFQSLKYTLQILEKYGFSFWDSMILASSILNNCTKLYSEDFQNNQLIEGKLRIINPFLGC